ncbi:hypothetical protein ACSAZK_09150 [Methanosarcina sp. Mfa9]|uniref:hypothetical protein n=1 Tax=Methanosarcina sp. Mfa9 TaxID=3439063 RepID=UPI003F867A2E
MIRDYTKIDICTFQKYISILIFLLFSVNSFILLMTPPECGYEPSIYGAYPLIFWIIMVTCIILSVLNIVLSISSNSKHWKYGLLSVFLCYSFLLFLPVIRGYEFFGTVSYDFFSHFASIYKIMDLGYLPDSLFYPICHILAVVLCYAGLPIKLSASLIAIIFLFLYILFLYLLGKVFFKNNSTSLFLLAFSLPLLFSFLHYAFIPFFFALSSIPHFLYCFHKKDSGSKVSFAVLTLILSLFIVFTHPLITLFLLVFLSLYHALFFIKQKYQFITFDHKSIFLSGISNMVLIIITSFLAWYLNFRNILNMFSKVVDALFDQGQDTILNSQVDMLQSSNAGILEIIEIFIKTYGTVFIYLFIASCCFIFILNKLRSKSVEELEIFYGFQFVVSIFIGLSMILGYFVVFEPIRTFSFAITMSTILCGIVFAKLYETITLKNGKKWISLFVVIIVCSSSVIGILNLYESPWKNQASPDMNAMMINGLNWFLSNHNESVPLVSDFKSPYKYERYYSQFYDNRGHGNLKHTLMDDTIVPSHFGYDINNTLFKSLGYNTKYMMIHEYMIQKSKYVIESQQFKYPIFLESDFAMLNNDSTVNKLYMNGEVEIWNV